MKIKASEKFLHGTQAYTQGRTYDVDTSLAVYFINNGWAQPEGDAAVKAATKAGANVVLDIHDSTHDQG